MDEQGGDYSVLMDQNDTVSNIDNGSSGTNANNSGFWAGASKFLGGFINGAGKYFQQQQGLQYNLQKNNMNLSAITSTIQYVALIIGGMILVAAIIKSIFKS